MQQFLSHVQNFLWGPGMLVLLLGTGLWLSWKSRFFQLRGWRIILRRTFGSLRKSAASADSAGSAPALTQFQTFSAALAAAMGTGNIIGVAGALCLGGAGAIFWMWISALLGMMLTYAENVLAVRYAGTRPDGSAVRGPMAYLRFGLGSRVLPFLYAVFCILASFGMGNMTQSSAISTLLQDAFPLPVWGIAAGIAVLLGCILLRGVRGAGSVLQWLMPLLAAGYMLAALAVILRHSAALPEAFRAIFRGAFGMRAVGGGISGAMLRSAIETGLRRGIFSNEAGLGSSALVHAGSDSKDASLQGLWSMTEVALDTLVCCTLTALALLTSGAARTGLSDTEQIAAAFSGIFGSFSPQIMAVVTALFAFCTMIGWCCCGEQAVHYLLGARGLLPYRLMFCAAAGAGAVIALPTVWALSDIANGLMALPNLLGLLLLCRHAGLEKLISRSRRNPAPQ